MGAQSSMTSTPPPVDWWFDPWNWIVYGEGGAGSSTGGVVIPEPPPLPGSADLPGMTPPPMTVLPPWIAPLYPYGPEPREYYEGQTPAGQAGGGGGSPPAEEQPSKPLGRREPGAPPTGPENEPPSPDEGGGVPWWAPVIVGGGAAVGGIAAGAGGEEPVYKTGKIAPKDIEPEPSPIPDQLPPESPPAVPPSVPPTSPPPTVPEPPPLPPGPIPQGPTPPTEPLPGPPEPTPGFNPWDALGALGNLAGALGQKQGGLGLPGGVPLPPLVGTNQPFQSLFGLPPVPQVRIPTLAQALRGGF